MKKASSREKPDEVYKMLLEAEEKKKKVKHLPERIWRKLHQKQTGQTCQIITALNAACVLTKGKKVVALDSNLFQHYISLAGARFGSAVTVDKVHEDLGIVSLKEYHSIHECWEFPFELNVWHKAHGFHSVCVVDYEWHTDAYRIANLSGATSLGGWIFYEDLQHYIRHGGKIPACRPFVLKEIKSGT